MSVFVIEWDVLPLGMYNPLLIRLDRHLTHVIFILKNKYQWNKSRSRSLEKR